MLKLTWPQVAAWRVRRHYLDQRLPAGNMLAVASRLCGLHAQVLSSAVLTLWARVEELDRYAVQRALWQDRTLVKTWAMRGTLHLVPSDDLPLWHAALTTSRRYRKPGLWRRFGLTLEELDRLTGSRKLAAKVGYGSWGTILKPAAMTGRLCFGPSVGQRVRFTRPSSWVASLAPSMDSEAATAIVTRRFLSAYGPATYHDLARWWGGGGVSTARQWITALGEEVRSVDLAGEQAWMLAVDAQEARDLPSIRSVRLIPAFDQYVIGASRHAEHLLPGDLRSRVYRRQGWISPVLLVNGFIHGVWHQEKIKGSRVDVVIEPFLKVPAWTRNGAEEEAERLAAFLGGTLRVVWKKVN